MEVCSHDQNSCAIECPVRPDGFRLTPLHAGTGTVVRRLGLPYTGHRRQSLRSGTGHQPVLISLDSSFDFTKAESDGSDLRVTADTG